MVSLDVFCFFFPECALMKFDLSKFEKIFLIQMWFYKQLFFFFLSLPFWVCEKKERQPGLGGRNIN